MYLAEVYVNISLPLYAHIYTHTQEFVTSFFLTFAIKKLFFKSSSCAQLLKNNNIFKLQYFSLRSLFFAFISSKRLYLCLKKHFRAQIHAHSLLYTHTLVHYKTQFISSSFYFFILAEAFCPSGHSLKFSPIFFIYLSCLFTNQFLTKQRTNSFLNFLVLVL